MISSSVKSSLIKTIRKLDDICDIETSEASLDEFFKEEKRNFSQIEFARKNIAEFLSGHQLARCPLKRDEIQKHPNFRLWIPGGTSLWCFESTTPLISKFIHVSRECSIYFILTVYESPKRFVDIKVKTNFLDDIDKKKALLEALLQPFKSKFPSFRHLIRVKGQYISAKTFFDADSLKESIEVAKVLAII